MQYFPVAQNTRKEKIIKRFKTKIYYEVSLNYTKTVSKLQCLGLTDKASLNSVYDNYNNAVYKYNVLQDKC